VGEAAEEEGSRMSNAARIVAAFDALLDHEVALVIYGRAAIALGFREPPVQTTLSLDVDVILRDSHTAALDADDQFWVAQEAVNAELDKDGLYITHLFGEHQVFLRRQWEGEIVPVLRLPVQDLVAIRQDAVGAQLQRKVRISPLGPFNSMNEVIMFKLVSSKCGASALLRDPRGGHANPDHFTIRLLAKESIPLTGHTT
jgi:hypothetical protein